MYKQHKCIAKTMRKAYKLKSYRFRDNLISQLDELKKYSIVESKFVKLAIEEKLQRDMKIIVDKFEKEKQKQYCPF